MAATETPARPSDAADVATPPGPTSGAATPAPTGLAAIVGTGDHKVVGRLFIATAFLFVLASGVCGELLSIDRVDKVAGNTILTQDNVFQVFTLHAVSGTFLFLLPLLIGVALVVVPLQVGAKTVAFPRAAAAAYWAFLVSGALLIASYVMNGGPGGGSSDGVDLFAVSLAAVLTALLLGVGCVVTTALTLRAPGMKLDRTPLFSWSMVAAGGVWLLSLPVLISSLVLIYVDHRHGQKSFGQSSAIYSHLRWAVGQPQVYAYAVPVLGIGADVVATFSGRRHSFHRIAMGAIGLFAVLGFGAFLPAFMNDKAVRQPLYILMAFAAVLPPLAMAGSWADGLRRGKVRWASPLLFTAAAFVMLLVGVLAGAADAVHPFDLHGTTWTTGAVHYVVMAAAIAGIGAVHHWATKILGRPLSEGLGTLAALALLGGTVLLAFPDLLSGVFGTHGDQGTGIEGLNVVAAIGGGLTVVGFLLAVLNIVGGVRRGRGAGTAQGVDADPWQGHTFEWLTSSPPASENFTEPLPVVTSAEPLLDARVAAETEQVRA